MTSLVPEELVNAAYVMKFFLQCDDVATPPEINIPLEK